MKRFQSSISLYTPRTPGMIVTYVLLFFWTAIVLFPLYWMVVTSFKLPIQVDGGPFYIPFVDFQPSLHAWQYILVGDLANDTRRQYVNTLVIATTSTVLVMIIGSAAAYGLTRFKYQ